MNHAQKALVALLEREMNVCQVWWTWPRNAVAPRNRNLEHVLDWAFEMASGADMPLNAGLAMYAQAAPRFQWNGWTQDRI